MWELWISATVITLSPYPIRMFSKQVTTCATVSRSGSTVSTKLCLCHCSAALNKLRPLLFMSPMPNSAFPLWQRAAQHLVPAPLGICRFDTAPRARPRESVWHSCTDRERQSLAHSRSYPNTEAQTLMCVGARMPSSL